MAKLREEIHPDKILLVRLGLFFGKEPRFWLKLQSEYDIRVADRELRTELAPRICVFQWVAA
jgi:plasmid maintenance system antidote protein VapI